MTHHKAAHAGRHRRSPDRPGRPGRRGATPVLVVLSCVAILAVVTGARHSVGSAGGALPAPASTALPASTPLPAAASHAPRTAPGTPLVAAESEVAASAAPSRPTRLRIPSIGVDTALQPLGLLEDGTLQPPSRWQRAGWFDRGVVPGDTGPAVIVGHVDSTSGPAVFYRLVELGVGARVTVTTHDGAVLHFVVDGSRHYAKSAFPTSSVYGPTPDAEIRLVTCTGTFDREAHSYRDNLVVSGHQV